MKGFKLYLYNNSNNPILFSYYNKENDNNTITFNEKLEENENDQFSLSFSIMKDINNLPIDIYSYLKIGRKLRLEYENHEDNNYIDFIIISISPEEYSNNIQYNFSCVDYASFVFTRNNIGLNFDSIENKEWTDLIDTGIYKNTLKDLGNYILRRGGLQYIDSESSVYGWTISYTEKVENKKVEWILEDNFTKLFDYQSGNDNYFIIDAVNYSNEIKIRYFETIWDDYRPGVKIAIKKYPFISSIILEKNGSSITGFGNIDTIDKNFIDRTINNTSSLYNSSNIILYYAEDGLELVTQMYLTLEIYGKIYVEREFNIVLSNSNTYNALIEIANLTNTIFKINYNTKIIAFYDKNESQFYKNYQLSPNFNIQNLSLNYSGEEFSSLLWVEGGEDDYKLNVGLTPTLFEDFINANWDYNTGGIRKFTETDYINQNYYSNIWLPEWGEEDIELTQIINKIPYLDNFLINLNYFRDNNLLDTSSYNILFDLIFNDLRIINIKYQSFIRKKYELEYIISTIESNLETYAKIFTKAEKSDYETYYTKIIEIFQDINSNYYYFDNLIKYNGYDYAESRLQYYRNQLVYYIDKRKESQSEINSLTVKLDSLSGSEDTDEYKSIQIKLNNEKEDFDGYTLLSGTWDYSYDTDTEEYSFVNTNADNNSYGIYCWIWHFFSFYWNDFLINNPKPTSETTLIDKYNYYDNEKKLKWYNIKKDYGHLLIEKYYKNDIEIDSFNLYKQAIIYFEDYKNPKDTYNITYLDISDIIGKNINAIAVGDYIQIRDYQLDIIPQSNDEIGVVSISRLLRNPASISLVVDRIKNTQRILEKILLGTS